MSTSTSRRRPHILGVRLTPDEHTEAEALAALLGTSVPSLVRSALHQLAQAHGIGQDRPADPPPSVLGRGAADAGAPLR